MTFSIKSTAAVSYPIPIRKDNTLMAFSQIHRYTRVLEEYTRVVFGDEMDIGLMITFLPALIITVVIAANLFAIRPFTLPSIRRKNSIKELSSELNAEHEYRKLSKRLKTLDQAMFTLSIVHISVTMYLMGAKPLQFHIWHTINCIVLLTIRWWTFRRWRQHYFLYDFCYWANIYSIVYVFFRPYRPEMFQVLFMIANGPLAWSILAFSSKVVFHSLSQMTSVFIHFSPMALTFCLRWNTSEHFKICEVDGHGDCLPMDPGEMITLAVKRFYLWWILIYYLWVFIVLDRRVKERGYVTLFTWFMTKSDLIGQLLRNVSSNDLIQKAVYVMGHYGFGVFTMAFATVLWDSFWAHLTFVLVIGVIAAWNGAGHYLHVFSVTYEEDVQMKADRRVSVERKRESVDLGETFQWSDKKIKLKRSKSCS